MTGYEGSTGVDPDEQLIYNDADDMDEAYRRADDEQRQRIMEATRQISEELWPSEPSQGGDN